LKKNKYINDLSSPFGGQGANSFNMIVKAAIADGKGPLAKKFKPW